jgi:hypothetical protein
MSQAEPYQYVRFTWWTRHGPTELVERLKSDFDVTPPKLEKDSPYDLSLFKGQRWETLVKADTLSALLSSSRAVLFQRTRAPFTQRDIELRKIVFLLYPHDRSTPFPWEFGHEPPFEVERE